MQVLWGADSRGLVTLKPLFIIGIFLVSLVLLFWIPIRPNYMASHPFYIYLVLCFVGFGLLAVFVRFVSNKVPLKFFKHRLVNITYFIVLLPMALFPLIRCWFKVPYIFCSVCPRKCPFGYVRPYIVPMAVLTNLKARFFCYNICPIGKLQTAQGSVNKKALRRNSLIVSLAFLIIAILMYFFVNPVNHPALFDFFYNGANVFSIATAIIALIIFIASFFVSRIWCDNICPIGGFARIYLKLKSLVGRNG